MKKELLGKSLFHMHEAESLGTVLASEFQLETSGHPVLEILSFVTVTRGFCYMHFNQILTHPFLQNPSRNPLCSLLSLFLIVKLPRGPHNAVPGEVTRVSSPNSQAILLFAFFCLFVFLEWLSRHMEVPRPGVESELQLLAYTTATATQDLSHSSWQRRILNPLIKVRDQTCILVDTSWVC